MQQTEQVDVLIVGSGPAGSSTALHLVRKDSSWADRIVVVDKAFHPREKLCGGGVTHMGQNILANIGLVIEPQKFSVRKVELKFKDKMFQFVGDPVFVVIRRDEFDHWLVQEAEARGVTVRQGETVKDVKTHDDYVEVTTDKTVFQAKVLVAADGSRSTVRSKLKWQGESRVARLLEVLTPEDAQNEAVFREQKAVFDFTPMADGLQGYYWDFPSVINGQPFMNRGVFDSRAHPELPKANLVQTLRDSMAERDRDLDDYKLKGHPIRWFDKNGCFSIPRVLLAGDSAGADPFVGEGISFALGYGAVAADALADAFERQDFGFASYRERILAHEVLKQLPIRVRLARLTYRFKSPRIHRLGWRIARFFIGHTRWGNPDYVPIKPPQTTSQPPA